VRIVHFLASFFIFSGREIRLEFLRSWWEQKKKGDEKNKPERKTGTQSTENKSLE
jgi:hypothetical protein